MLSFDLRALEEGPVVTEATVPADHPALAGLTMQLVGPVEVGGRLVGTSGDDVLWHGHLGAQVAGECRRCLEPTLQVLDEFVEVVFSANEELLEDPSVYPLDVRASDVDLGQAVREELVLRVEPFPLCRPDCAGLCPTCGADLNAGPCGCAVPGTTN
jgi:uncharacterized protein